IKNYFFVRSAKALHKIPIKSIEIIKIVTDFIHIILEKKVLLKLKKTKIGPINASNKLIGIR
ncbi:hypothetical protein, partial [Listeria innocua]|uniref:hypothetical protein n=1 Tax=Listeria innocua TaxID=1642 RepID=UPI001F19F896